MLVHLGLTHHKASTLPKLEKYVSFVLYFLEQAYNSDPIPFFYDSASWICYSNKDYDIKERVKLFKLEVIKPLCDYVIDELRKNVSLMYVLDNYKTRTMRFETPYSQTWNEHDVQNKLAKYLFDNGYYVHKEEDISNGRPDFLFSDEDNNPFIIEVKFIKEKISKNIFKKYTSQLRDYMSKLESHLGVLYIFTIKDLEFVWNNKPNNMEIRTIYVGEKNPSKRNIETISIDL